ncbi:MAG: hypothetical protein HFJ84_10155 [Clostridiales bacterium]|jgi:hypothetical protein|nr:hypothetical protein [Clostridiales bacterium]
MRTDGVLRWEIPGSVPREHAAGLSAWERREDMTEEQTLSAYRAALKCLRPDGDIARQMREKMRKLQQALERGQKRSP